MERRTRTTVRTARATARNVDTSYDYHDGPSAPTALEFAVAPIGPFD
jgi:hypothetical protein